MGKLRVASRQNGPEVTTYLQEFQTDGKAQKDFTETYGESNGQCVKQNVSEGMSQAEVQQAVADCAQ